MFRLPCSSMFILCFYGKSPINRRFPPRSSWDFYGAQSWHKGDVAKAEPLISWANRTGVTTMTLGPGKPWHHGEAMGICWGYVMTYGIWDVNGDMSWDLKGIEWENMGISPICNPWCWYIKTYMTGWFCSGKCWCAYSSTMEHLGTRSIGGDISVVSF